MIYRRGDAFLDTASLKVWLGQAPGTVAGEIPEPAPAGAGAVQAVVTRRCNLKCSYCNVRLSGDSCSTMDAQTVEKVIEMAGSAASGRLLMITGGEPFLVPDLVFQILRECAPPSVVFTNATLITPSMAEKLKDTGAAAVVSLDGSRENHDPARSGSWDRAAKGMDNLRAAGVGYGISMVCGTHNHRTVPGDIRRLYSRFSPTGFGVNILHWTHGDFVPPSGEEYARVMSEVFAFALEKGVFVDQIARRIDPLVYRRYRHRDCSAMGGKVVVHSDGTVSNCISGRTMEDWSRRIPFFMEACRGCPAAGVCGGGCAWDGIHLGEDGGPDPRHCIWVKRILDLFLDDVQRSFPSGPVSGKALLDRYGSMVTRGSCGLTSSLGHR